MTLQRYRIKTYLATSSKEKRRYGRLFLTANDSNYSKLRRSIHGELLECYAGQFMANYSNATQAKFTSFTRFRGRNEQDIGAIRVIRRKKKNPVMPARPDKTKTKEAIVDDGLLLLAERQGFEPWDQQAGQRFSRPPRSTTPASLRITSNRIIRVIPKFGLFRLAKSGAKVLTFCDTTKFIFHLP